MVDESYVTAGQAQRRRGMHIDGYWVAGHHPDPEPTIRIGHRSIPVPLDHHRPAPRHNPVPDWSPAPLPRHGSAASDWESATFEAPEAIILASTHRACRGFTGTFEGPIKDGGDCDHIDLSGLTRISLDPHTAYVGNVTALHESIPVAQDCYRQLVRLNVPGWSPTA